MSNKCTFINQSYVTLASGSYEVYSLDHAEFVWTRILEKNP